MKVNILQNLFFFALIFTAGKNVFTAEKTLSLTGMKIFSEKEIIDKLSTSSRPLSKLPSLRIIDKIKDYYTGNGYTIAKIYIIENNRDKLSLYVDEGNLSRVVFLNINTLKTLKLKYWYRLPENVFNIKQVRKIVHDIKEKEGFPDVSYRLVPSEKYDESFFQLDRVLNLPVIGKTQLPFVDKYASRFHLEFRISKLSVESAVKKKVISTITFIQATRTA